MQEDRNIDTVSYRLSRIEAKLDKVCNWMTGNGHPQRGVLSRLAELEERERESTALRRKVSRVLWATIIAAVSSAAATAANLFSGQHP